jgi:DNA-directed RNA polymerase subunit omega
MAQRRGTLMDPPIEDLLDKVDSKFTLVALASKRARQINSYYNQLGEGMGVVVPPQVTSVSGKPLTIAFEEVSGGKAQFHRPEPGEEGEEEVVAEIDFDLGGLGSAAPVGTTDAFAEAVAAAEAPSFSTPEPAPEASGSSDADAPEEPSPDA